MTIISQFQKQIKTDMLQKHYFKFHTEKKRKQVKENATTASLGLGIVEKHSRNQQIFTDFLLRGDEHVPVMDKLQSDLRNKK